MTLTNTFPKFALGWTLFHLNKQLVITDLREPNFKSNTLQRNICSKTNDVAKTESRDRNWLVERVRFLNGEWIYTGQHVTVKLCPHSNTKRHLSTSRDNLKTHLRTIRRLENEDVETSSRLRPQSSTGSRCSIVAVQTVSRLRHGQKDKTAHSDRHTVYKTKRLSDDLNPTMCFCGIFTVVLRCHLRVGQWPR